MTKQIEPFKFIFHAGEVGHTCAAGPVGSGKTTYLAHVMASEPRLAAASVDSRAPETPTSNDKQ